MIDVSTINPRALYTIKDVCAIFAIHRNTLRNHVNAGFVKVTASRHTFRPLFRGVDLINYAKTI